MRVIIPEGKETKFENFVLSCFEVLDFLQEFKYLLIMFLLWGNMMLIASFLE